MTDDSGGDAAREAVDRLRGELVAAAERLAAAGARTEVLAELVEPRRVLGVARAPRMAQLGRVWRLGVVLLASDGSAYATGHVVRAELPARRSILADSVAEHRGWQAAAVKGGITTGESVDFDARPVDLDALARDGASGPFVLHDGAVFVRWNPSQPDALADAGRYLADRAELLANPPSGT